MFRLAPRRLFPVQPEPGEIIEQRRFEMTSRSSWIDVLYTNQKPPAALKCNLPIKQSRIRMAEMKVAIGRRSESKRWLRADAGQGSVILPQGQKSLAMPLRSQSP